MFKWRDMKKNKRSYYWIILVGVLYNFILLARSEKSTSENTLKRLSVDAPSIPVTNTNFSKL
jgi:hypothetical protein